MKPIQSPTNPPSKSPSKSPTKRPTRPPTKAPTKLPTKSPTKRPTKHPANPPTKHPTRRPTKAPTKAPNMDCRNGGIAIVQYINSITLSNRTLSLVGTTRLEKALLDLVQSNRQPGVGLSACLADHQDRFRQRFAYLALVHSTVPQVQPSWFANANECLWTGITCNGNNRVAKVELFDKGLQGTIPADVGLWTSLTHFNVAFNKLTGSLPSSIGKWADLTTLYVSENKLMGTIPKEVSNWKSIQEALFYGNMFNGTMPRIGNDFCPDNGSYGALLADCQEIVCHCCNTCL
jgi:hypothetical protein